MRWISASRAPQNELGRAAGRVTAPTMIRGKRNIRGERHAKKDTSTMAETGINAVTEKTGVGVSPSEADSPSFTAISRTIRSNLHDLHSRFSSFPLSAFSCPGRPFAVRSCRWWLHLILYLYLSEPFIYKPITCIACTVCIALIAHIACIAGTAYIACIA